MTLMRSTNTQTHTCRTILMVADAKPEKQRKVRITLRSTWPTDEHDRMKCENLRTLKTPVHHP